MSIRSEKMENAHRHEILFNPLCKILFKWLEFRNRMKIWNTRRIFMHTRMKFYLIHYAKFFSNGWNSETEWKCVIPVEFLIRMMNGWYFILRVRLQNFIFLQNLFCFQWKQMRFWKRTKCHNLILFQNLLHFYAHQSLEMSSPQTVKTSTFKA